MHVGAHLNVTGHHHHTGSTRPRKWVEEAELGGTRIRCRGLQNGWADVHDAEVPDHAVADGIERDDSDVRKRDVIRRGAGIEVAAQNLLFRAATACRGQEEEEDDY